MVPREVVFSLGVLGIGPYPEDNEVLVGIENLELVSELPLRNTNAPAPWTILDLPNTPARPGSVAVTRAPPTPMRDVVSFRILYTTPL